MGRFEPDCIAANLEVVEKSHKHGKIKNLPAYTYKAIVNDYRVQEAKTEHDKQAKNEAEKQQRQQLESDYDAHRQEVVDSIKDGFDTVSLIEEFQSVLPALCDGNIVLKNHVRKVGTDAATVEGDATLRSYYYQYLLDNYALPEIRSFDAWKQSKFRK